VGGWRTAAARGARGADDGHAARPALPPARRERHAARRLWGRRRLAPNLARAAAIVAVSRSTADELARHAVCDLARVHVIPNAGSPGVRRVEDPAAIAALRRRLHWNARYVLAIGPLERHKRPLFLLEALAAARAHPGGADLGLVLAGRTVPAAAQALAARAAELGVQEAVRLTGPLDDGALSAALSGADALLLGSTCEGFAIPVVDAQCCGVPVVAVQAGAAEEVAGQAAWLVPPGDAAAAGAAIVAAVSAGPERERRVAAGRELAARWSWERSAQQLETLWLALASRAHRR
jgi:glycosyltransferase involved in cell wall biosynthesis